jgi:hypothetical protein
MRGQWNQRSLTTRLLMYAVAATLAFVMATSVGALAALVASGNLSWPTGERPSPEEARPAGEQGESVQRQRADVDLSQQGKAGAKQEQAVSQDNQTAYVHEVGEIQANSVERFLDSNEKLLHYDALAPGDVKKMQANKVALQVFAAQASDLNAPHKYTQQKDAFLSAIEGLHQAAQLAYALAADPISATQDDFDAYDRLVKDAAAGLQQSNEILDKDYKRINDVRSVS